MQGYLFISILSSLLASYHVASVMIFILLVGTLFLQCTSAATFPTQPALFSNAASPNIDTTAANTSALSSDFPVQYVGPADAGPKVKCDKTYGSNLDRLSCFDAWQRFLWQDTQRRLFAQRGTKDNIEQVLPKRISSRMSLFVF